MNKHPIVVLDGIKTKVEPPDLDGDGITGGLEILQRATDEHGIIPHVQPTELGESLSKLDDDRLDPETKMSQIDMNAILDPFEETFILAFDSLIAFKICPPFALRFTRQKKRLSVSRHGRGREQKVEMVVGKREHDRDTGRNIFQRGWDAVTGGNQNGN